MNSSETDLLLQRYLDGETSLKEEESLRMFLSNEDLPEKYHVYAHMFEGLKAQKMAHIPDKRFRRQLYQKMKSSETGHPVRSIAFSWYLVSGVAAVVILAVLLFVPIAKYPLVNLFSERIEDTFDDPQKAYAETFRVLLQVSEKLNAGTRQMDGIGKFEKGLNDANKMLTINQGVKRMEKLNKLEEQTRPVRKLNKLDQGMNKAQKLSRFNENQTDRNNL